MEAGTRRPPPPPALAGFLEPIVRKRTHRLLQARGSGGSVLPGNGAAPRQRRSSAGQLPALRDDGGDVSSSGDMSGSESGSGSEDEWWTDRPRSVANGGTPKSSSVAPRLGDPRATNRLAGEQAEESMRRRSQQRKQRRPHRRSASVDSRSSVSTIGSDFDEEVETWDEDGYRQSPAHTRPSPPVVPVQQARAEIRFAAVPPDQQAANRRPRAYARRLERVRSPIHATASGRSGAEAQVQPAQGTQHPPLLERKPTLSLNPTVMPWPKSITAGKVSPLIQDAFTRPMAHTTSAVTVLGEGVQFDGDLRFDQKLEVGGQCNGSLVSNGSGVLRIRPGGKVVGDIVGARNVVVDGVVDGNLVADNVTLGGRAVITGQIAASDIHDARLSTNIHNLSLLHTKLSSFRRPKPSQAGALEPSTSPIKGHNRRRARHSHGDRPTPRHQRTQSSLTRVHEGSDADHGDPHARAASSAEVDRRRSSMPASGLSLLRSKLSQRHMAPVRPHGAGPPRSPRSHGLASTSPRVDRGAALPAVREPRRSNPKPQPRAPRRSGAKSDGRFRGGVRASPRHRRTASEASDATSESQQGPATSPLSRRPKVGLHGGSLQTGATDGSPAREDGRGFGAESKPRQPLRQRVVKKRLQLLKRHMSSSSASFYGHARNASC